MNRIQYHAYLLTPAWHAIAERAKARDGHRCRICNSPDNLEVHHRTYERVGHERLSDLTTLCGECHGLYSNRNAGGWALVRSLTAALRGKA
jgi:5-methylcytosine-specific restriction endonuclease McrA